MTKQKHLDIEVKAKILNANSATGLKSKYQILVKVITKNPFSFYVLRNNV